MSEFGPSPLSDEEKERQGIAIAEEIANLRNGAETDDDYRNILAKTAQLKELYGLSPETKLSGEVLEQINEAKEIFGNDCLGPDEIKEAFGIDIEMADIPNIPFSRRELEKAKELGQMLILRAPMTMIEINDRLSGKVKDGMKLLYSFDETGKPKDDCWYKAEEFLDGDRIELRWALVSKSEVPNSTSKNYLEQMEPMIDYLKQSFDGIEMLEEYAKAIEEYALKKDEIAPLIDSDWEKAAEELEKLQLNQLLRQSPTEALYDLVLYFQKNGTRLMENMYTWTSRRASSGRLVDVGAFESGGVDVSRNRPGTRYSPLGVSFSRSL